MGELGSFKKNQNLENHLKNGSVEIYYKKKQG